MFNFNFQQNIKEYKNKIIGLSFRVDDKELENKQLLQQVEMNEKLIKELQESKRELESKIEINKDLCELIDKKEEIKAKDIVSNFMKQPDGIGSLSIFVHILQQKIKKYEEELKECNEYIYKFS
jgi:hypothetical protein